MHVFPLLCALFAVIPPDTEVLRSIPERDLVGISAGSSAGIVEKERFVVLRDGVVIAEGEIVRAGEHTAIGRITRREGQLFPTEGDKVSAPGTPAKKPAPPKKTAPPKQPAPKEPAPAEPPKKTAPAEPPKEPAPAVPPKEPAPAAPEKQPAPPAAPAGEELLAAGACGNTIFVSSTECVYRIDPGGVRRDRTTVPHSLLRFVPWGDRLWAETNGGVFLLEKGRWIPCNWTDRFSFPAPTFARVTCTKDYTWGSFGDRLLFWDTRATKIELEPASRTTTKGVWVQLGTPVGEEIEALIARRDGTLAAATAARKIIARDKGVLRPLCELAFTNDDPLVLELAEDAGGVLWGLSFAPGGGVFSVAGDKATLVRRVKSGDPTGLPEGRLLRLATDPAGVPHVLHEIEGVFRHADGAWKHAGARPPEKAVDIAFHGGAVLLLTERRLLRLGETPEELFVLGDAPPEE